MCFIQYLWAANAIGNSSNCHPLCYQHIHSVTSIDTHGAVRSKGSLDTFRNRCLIRTSVDDWWGPISQHVDALRLFLAHIHIIYTYNISWNTDSMAMIAISTFALRCGIWITINDNYSVSPGHTSCSPLVYNEGIQVTSCLCSGSTDAFLSASLANRLEQQNLRVEVMTQMTQIDSAQLPFEEKQRGMTYDIMYVWCYWMILWFLWCFSARF